MANQKIGKSTRADQIRNKKGTRSRPPKDKPFVCCVCKKEFEKRDGVMSHAKSSHFNRDWTRMLICGCGMALSRSDIDGHIC